MSFFSIFLIILLGVILTFTYFKFFKKKQEIEYIWVGHGKDPFKNTK
jgi:positive regulator of sigma E activity